MARKRLTSSVVAGLAPRPSIYEVSDADLPAFRVRIRPSGVKTYSLLYRNTKGRQVRYTLGKHGELTPTQARRLAESVIGDVRKGLDPARLKKDRRDEARRDKAASQTLRDVLAGEFAAHANPGCLERIPTAFEGFLDTPLPEITRWNLQRWAKDTIAAGKKQQTIDRDLSFLSEVFRFAVGEGWVSANPTKKPDSEDRDELRRTAKKSRRPPRFLDAGEEKRLRAALAERDAKKIRGRQSGNRFRAARKYDLKPELGQYADHITPMALLVLNTGIRPGAELFGIEWRDVNFRARELTIREDIGKGGRGRVLPLNGEAVAVLKAWRGKARDGLVFPNRHGGRIDNINTAWRAVVKAAGLKNCPPYSLRHTFATTLVNKKNVPLPVVQRLMGHSKIETTLIYVHVVSDDMAQAVASLAR